MKRPPVYGIRLNGRLGEMPLQHLKQIEFSILAESGRYLPSPLIDAVQCSEKGNLCASHHFHVDLKLTVVR